MTRHCHQCGWEYKLACSPARTESCHQCGSDLRVCLNCTHYDVQIAYQCRERRADPVYDKHLANFCEHFDFIRRDWKPKNDANPREQSARDTLKKLLGD